MTTCQVLLGCHDPGLYDRLYPAGWCLVEDLATQHRHTWASLASSLSGEDSGYTALTQILIMFQVNQHCTTFLGSSRVCNDFIKLDRDFTAIDVFS